MGEALSATRSLAAGIDVIDAHPPAQARDADPQIPRDRRDRLLALAGERNNTTTELRRLRSRHGVTPLRDDPRLRTGVRETGSGSPRTREFAARRCEAGDSRKDTLRVLKRYIARETFTLIRDALTHPAAHVPAAA
jgi:hypothetical protein